jgi:internalin A
LSNNKDLEIPEEMLILNGVTSSLHENLAQTKQILDYYFHLKGMASKPLNEAKLVLVGFGAVGKTSLVNRLVNDRFNPSETKTEGILTTDWRIGLPDGDAATLHIWDFGGQEIMHATHQFFLTKRSVYLLVLAGRQGREDSDAEYWLNLVSSFGGDSPVIIVLNRIREHAFGVNARLLKQKFPQIQAVIETDCEDGSGIGLLRSTIADITNKLTHLRMPFPAAWAEIKDRLAAISEDYLSFERYRALCAECGEHDPQAQESLAATLHSLGIALNFKDDLRLSDTHVLNPRWATEGVYRIINHPSIRAQHGNLHTDQLSSILDTARYPIQRHDFLLQLMRKFELCFPFEEAGTRYLIPELLGKEQPEEVATFNKAECLNFVYRYDTLVPEGLIPRFIVRSQVLSSDARRWHTGVILSLEGNRALVVADQAARALDISVDGPVEGRRRLLAVVRSDFDHIHSSYRFNPEEVVPVPGHPEVGVPYKDLLIFEKSGEKTIKFVANGKVLSLEVTSLLAGVESSGIRSKVTDYKAMSFSSKVFVSYSHKDEKFRAELDTHLKLLQREGLLSTWNDRKIMPGEEWKGAIDNALEQADLILLLVSPDFISSDYCYDIEMAKALQRHASQEAVVVPILVRETNWRIAPFAKLQATPSDNRWVAGPGARLARDRRWREVSESLESVVKAISRKHSIR